MTETRWIAVIVHPTKRGYLSAMNDRGSMKFVAARWVSALILAGTLAACHSRSEDYNRLQELPADEWVAFASSLPIERRLDLHVEVEGSSHNPPHTITAAFYREPLGTYRALVARIQAGDTSFYYMGVLYEINRSPSFSICEQKDRQIVQGYLWSNATGAVNPDHRPEFFRC